MRLGVQIYTVREFISTKDAYLGSLKKIKDMGYDSVQTYVTHFSPEEHKKILDTFGLVSESAGGDYEAMLHDPSAIETAIKEAEQMGTDLISIGTLPVEQRDHESGFHTYAENINQICRELKKAGKKLLYHPHALEFFSFGNEKNGMEILTEETDPETFWFALDTHWLQCGGQNPAAYIKRMKGRLPMVHFKDYKIIGGAEYIEQVCKDFAEVGEGNLNWAEIVDACRASNVKSVVVEQDICQGDPFDCLRTSYENMKSFGL